MSNAANGKNVNSSTTVVNARNASIESKTGLAGNQATMVRHKLIAPI